MSQTHETRVQVRNGLVVATLFIAFSAIITFVVTEQELRLRLFGISMGIMVAYYGNAVSKNLTPLARLRCDPITEQALRRFSAWSLTLAGLAYVIVYLAFPPDEAVMIATGLLGFAVLLVVGRTVWTKMTRKMTRE